MKKVLLLLCLLLAACSGKTASAAVTPAPAVTPVSTKEAAADFDPKTNQTVTVGDFSLQVPANWQQKENDYYAETGEGISFLQVELQELEKPFTEEEFLDIKDSVAEDFSKKLDGGEVVLSETITVNGITMNELIVQGKVSDILVRIHICMFVNPSDGNVVTVSFLQSDKSAYDHEEDYRKVIQSLQKNEEEPVEQNETSSAIRPEIKEAIDSYEAFFDEYIAFMKSFDASSTDMTMMLRYTSFLQQYQETMEKFEAMEEDLNDAEHAYYLEVMLRVEKKLLEVTY
ncbi:MAG: hypothetical protein IKE21_06965 [Erysipelotrichaceae bacterium]|nr:hypothetical protein [Erysipelotrichaceae bacterium]